MSDPVTIGQTDKKDIKEKVSGWNIFKKATAPSTAVTRPVSSIKAPPTNQTAGNKILSKLGKKNNEKNEIFVDIFEKLSVSIYIVTIKFSDNNNCIV